MPGESGTRTRADSILANKGFWIGVGLAFFVPVGFILPVPHSPTDALTEYGYVGRMIDWGIAENASEAAAKTMIVLGIVPMAILFFATEALPIGVMGSHHSLLVTDEDHEIVGVLRLTDIVALICQTIEGCEKAEAKKKGIDS